MKNRYLFIALALCATLAVSCGNRESRKAKSGEDVQVAAVKEQIREDVLVSIDSLAAIYNYEGSDKDLPIRIIMSCLGEEQKLVKPDYLMDPQSVEDLTSHRQKVNALAILITERPVREFYGLPLEESDKAVAKLLFDLNHPFSLDDVLNLTVSEKLKNAYAVLKERNELCYLWQFNAAIQNNVLYLIAFNLDTFFDNVTDEQYELFHRRLVASRKAVRMLAEYDDEIASALAFQEKNLDFEGSGDMDSVLARKEAGKEFIQSRKADYVKIREFVLL